MVSSTNPLKLENSILVLGTSLGNSGDATASGLVPWPQKWRLMLTDSYRFYGYFMVFTYRSGGNTRLPCSFPLKKNVTGWIFDRISAAKEFGAQDRPSATEPDSAQRGGERRWWWISPNQSMDSREKYGNMVKLQQFQALPWFSLFDSFSHYKKSER